MRLLLSLTLLLVLTLLGCNTTTSTEAVVTSTPPPAVVTTQDVDQPKMSADEASSLIYSSLSSRLPVGYKMEQFDPGTRQVVYLGQGKWEFTMLGEGQRVSELPDEKIEKSEILWVYQKKEMVTTYHLVLVADYFEKTGVCEIQKIDKIDEETATNILSSREVEARLKVKLIKLQYFATRLQVQMTVENNGYVPLKGIVMNITYDKPLQVVSSTNFDGILEPEKTTVLLKLFEDENIKDFKYPDEFSFATSANSVIPFTVNDNAYSVNNF
jgi:hypothetical protein